MDDPPPQPSKPFFGTVREEGLRLRFAIGFAPAIALIVGIGFGDLGAALTAGGLLGIGLGVNALGLGRWMQPTEAIHTTPANRTIIKLFIVLALLAGLATIVTKSATVGYVAFSLALVSGVTGLWPFVGPRKRSGSAPRVTL
jgi:hypothetical protein